MNGQRPNLAWSTASVRPGRRWITFLPSDSAISFLCLLLLLASPPRGTARAAETMDMEDYLRKPYYEIEFFVFERPKVLAFSSEEALALNAPRALPSNMRSQRLEGEHLWTDHIDPLTRVCLTFPTLSYEWVSPADAPDDREGEPAAPEVPVDTRPVPEIHPYLEPDPVLDFLAELARFERSLEERVGRWQPAEAWLLGTEASRLERSGLGRVLFHGRWLADVPPREAPAPLLIRGGERLSLPEEVHELVGTVSVTLGRYLHFAADVYLHGPAMGMEPAVAILDQAGEVTVRAPDIPRSRYMRLSQSRRMRSEEIHYLDHPKLGIVVRIDPVALPPELIEAYERMEEDVQ